MPQWNMTGEVHHPVEATAIGILQNGKLMVNMFLVLWSDQKQVLIYRKSEDFKKLNKNLRRKYPVEAGFYRKSDRIIPKLRDIPICIKSTFINRFIQKLLLLERYSRELLKIDRKISRCNLVINFFLPRNEDLAPSYDDDSVVIVLSDVKPEMRDCPRKMSTESAIKPPASSPIASEHYVCIEDYETVDTKRRPFKVKRDEMLSVLFKESSGWWFVENVDKCTAWFPASYLRDLKGSEDTDSGMDSDDEGTQYYVSIAHDAMTPDEISVRAGALVDVMEKTNTFWWLVRYNSKTGFIPALKLKPYHSYGMLYSMLHDDRLNTTSDLDIRANAAGLKASAPQLRSYEESYVGNYSDKEPLVGQRSSSMSRQSSDPYSQVWKPKPMARRKGHSTNSSTESDDVPVMTRKNNVPFMTRQNALDLCETNIYGEIPDRYPKVHPLPSAPHVPQWVNPREIFYHFNTVAKHGVE